MTEEFDIIKWRKENPMDYLKAMKIIDHYADPQQKNIAFRSIYDVTRLHIPDTLHKFFSLTNDHQLNISKLETFKRQLIFLSDIKSLNDPFDAKAYYYDPKALNDIERLAPHGGKLIDDFSAFVKVSALTANDYSSMPMWAHYANNHRGFCISYDMNQKENIQLRSCTFPVQYTDERIDVTGFVRQQALSLVSEIEKQSAKGIKTIVIDDLSMVFMSLFFCNIKHKSWAYEKEYRCTTGSSAKGMPYVTAKPKEIYTGLNCTNRDLSDIVEITKAMGIPAYRTVFDELSPSFALSIKQV